MNEYYEIPDFSGDDDFADDKDILADREATRIYKKMIEDSLSIVRQELNMQEASQNNYMDFHMFKILTPTIDQSFKSINNAIQVSIARYVSTYPIGKTTISGVDRYFFGHITLKSNYPGTYIHKETIREIIAEIFLNREVDFEHSKKFSRAFHVLTEDKYRLENLLQLKNLDSLVAYPDMELEFNKNTLLFRTSRKPVSVEESTLFCGLAKTLLTIFG